MTIDNGRVSGEWRGECSQCLEFGGAFTSPSAPTGERREFPSRWRGVAWAVAIFFGLLSARSSPADETLTLQGASPQLILDDNVGTNWKWTVQGDDGAFEIKSFDGTSTVSRFRMTPTALDIGSVHFGGGLGIGTTTPQAHLHIFSSGLSTSIRLQSQDDLSAAANWELLSDSQTGFRLINRLSNKFPFTIVNGAPNGSIYVDAVGRVGMGGGALPDENSKLDLRSNLTNGVLAVRQDGNAHYLRVQNALYAFRCGVQANGDAQFGALSSGKGLNLIAGGTSKVLVNSSGQFSFGNAPPAITTHALVHQTGARLTAGGTWTNASSRAVKQDIEPITSEEARDTVRALQPVGYRYKNELDERYVGFIAEDVPELVATRDRKALAPMDIVGVLTKVVQDQDRELAQQRQAMAAQDAALAALTKRLADLEQRMAVNGGAER